MAKIGKYIEVVIQAGLVMVMVCTTLN
ncbi:hypothetical protein F6V25_06995 [Oryzomonas japonica]|uniref:Uncharacterized protein n=1 Tax=Oryzomonas japonica TaxID=2603858 RepID=A0A7J4ZSN7_9BACT|nr:hypothetical protein F6V25_06995 [Oryzomonas japonica]